jgi:hypothetical protein
MTLQELYDVAESVDYVVLNNVEYRWSYPIGFATEKKDKKIPFEIFNKYIVTSINCVVESVDWDYEEAVMYVNIKERDYD